MATSITPKSELRKFDSITVGYGEVPTALTEDGKQGWGLPGDKITFCVEEAKAMAAKLDVVIRKALRGSRSTLI